MISPRDRFKLALFLSQEIALDSCTPGQEAMDRNARNGRQLWDMMQSWALDCLYNPEELMQEVWQHDDKAKERYAAREKKAKGRKSR